MTRQFRAHKPKPSGPAKPAAATVPAAKPAETEAAAEAAQRPKEVGGPEGPEPTRYGDWERKGLCVDF